MTTPLDSPWKEILEDYFPQFMAFFFPDAYSEIDWAKEFTTVHDLIVWLKD